MLFAGEDWCCLRRSGALCRGAVRSADELCCSLLYKESLCSTIELSTSAMVFLLLPMMFTEAVLGLMLFAEERCCRCSLRLC